MFLFVSPVYALPYWVKPGVYVEYAAPPRYDPYLVEHADKSTAALLYSVGNGIYARS